MSLRTQYISSHLFFLTLLQHRASAAPSLLLCQYGDSAALCVCFLRSGGHSLAVFLSLRHCSCCVVAPTACWQAVRTPLWGSAHFCPAFRLTTPNGSQIQCVKEALFDWPVIIQDTVTTLGGALASTSLIGYWTSRVPRPLGQASILCSICYNQGSRALTYIVSAMHRTLSAADCMARGCGSAWQSPLTFLQNNVLVCCLPS